MVLACEELYLVEQSAECTSFGKCINKNVDIIENSINVNDIATVRSRFRGRIDADDNGLSGVLTFKERKMMDVDIGIGLLGTEPLLVVQPKRGASQRFASESLHLFRWKGIRPKRLAFRQ